MKAISAICTAGLAGFAAYHALTGSPGIAAIDLAAALLGVFQLYGSAFE